MVTGSAPNVKTNAVATVSAAIDLHTGRFHFVWVLYLLSSIAVLGMIIGFPLYIPLKGAGTIFRSRRLVQLAENIFCAGNVVLMRLQPWYGHSASGKSQVDIKKPSAATRGSRGLLIVSNHRSHLDVFILLS